jgi:hypothetical protein
VTLRLKSDCDCESEPEASNAIDAVAYTPHVAVALMVIACGVPEKGVGAVYVTMLAYCGFGVNVPTAGE